MVAGRGRRRSDVAAEDVALTDQLRYVRCAWGEKDLLDTANLFDAPALHDNDRVRQLLHFGVIVRHQHDRDGKTALEAFEGVAQAFAHGGIEGVEGFIEQQQAWLGGQRVAPGA